MILCCGEALIDMLPRAATTGEMLFAAHPGGAVFNTAVALGRLGVPVEFFSGLSSDLFGELLRDTLHASHVGTRFVRVSGRPTTLAFVRLVDGQASYVFYDENTAGRMLAAGDLPELDDRIAALHFGAISLIPEPCGSAYEALMARECSHRVTMLDPNIRPNFIPDRERHLARLSRMIAMADIVKVSQEDLAWFGEQAGEGGLVRRWLASGPKLVVVTRGADGATAYTRRDTVSMPARKVVVVDTVGAGDTFNAGLLAAFHEAGQLTKAALAALDRDALCHALELATRVAAVTVSRAGANPPWRHELGGV